MVALPANDLAAKQALGEAIPAPIRVRAVIDTGTDITAVSASILQPMGLTLAASGSTHTASGSVSVKLFEISLVIPGSDPTVLLVVRPQLLVMELTAVIPDVDLLLGRDVLDECLFFYDGPGKQFILAS